MARNIPAALQTALNTGRTTICFCWKIMRQDGTIMGFTDHDTDLTFGSVTFKRSTSFTASQMENQLGLAVSNLEVLGYLGSNTITEDDIECGRYDGAILTIYIVNWQDPENQNAIVMNGSLGQITVGDLSYQTELRSLMQHFQEYVGALCQNRCRADLGDNGTGLEGGCHFAMPAPVSGMVTSVTSRTLFTVSASGTFLDGTRGSLSGGYFAEGTVKFTSGANIGVSTQLLNSTYAATSPLSTVGLTTKLPLPDDIQVGDAVQLQIGCDKTLDVCIKNYDQVLNRRAEDYVPGTDAVFRVHGA